MESKEELPPIAEGGWDICSDRGSQMPIGRLFDGVGLPITPGDAAYSLNGDHLIDPAGIDLGQLRQFYSCWAIHSETQAGTVGIVLRRLQG